MITIRKRVSDTLDLGSLLGVSDGSLVYSIASHELAATVSINAVTGVFAASNPCISFIDVTRADNGLLVKRVLVMNLADDQYTFDGSSNPAAAFNVPTGFVPEDSSKKNQPNGYLGLDADGKFSKEHAPDDLGGGANPHLAYDPLNTKQIAVDKVTLSDLCKVMNSVNTNTDGASGYAVLTSSPVTNDGYGDQYAAFDSNGNTFWHENKRASTAYDGSFDPLDDGTHGNYLGMQFPSGQAITHVALTSVNPFMAGNVGEHAGDTTPSQIEFLGFDGSSWQKVGEALNQTGWYDGERRIFALSKPGSYSKLIARFLGFNGSPGYFVGIQQMEIMGSVTTQIPATIEAIKAKQVFAWYSDNTSYDNTGAPISVAYAAPVVDTLGGEFNNTNGKLTSANGGLYAVTLRQCFNWDTTAMGDPKTFVMSAHYTRQDGQADNVDFNEVTDTQNIYSTLNFFLPAGGTLEIHGAIQGLPGTVKNGSYIHIVKLA
jgi:hypothetical protein